MRSGSRTAFSLIELLVVIIIIGILATLGLAQYGKVVERRYYGESEDLLYAIYSGERDYYFSNGVYLNNPSTDADWRLIRTDNPNNYSSLPVTFSVSASGATFTATGTRNGGTCNNNTITIKQDRLLGGTWSSCSGL